MKSTYVSCLAGIVFLLVFATAQAADTPVAGTTVELPQYVVTATQPLPAAEQWRYTKIGSYEILAQADDKTIQQLVERLALMPQVVSAVWPAPNVPIASTALILCDSNKSFGEFVPQSVTKDIGATWIDRIFFKNDAGKIVVFKSDAGHNEGRYRDILRDYAKERFRSMLPMPPDWFITGMSEVIADAECSEANGTLTIKFGKMEFVKNTVDEELLQELGMDSGGLTPNVMLNPPTASLVSTLKPSAATLDLIHGALSNRRGIDTRTDQSDAVNRLRFNTYFFVNHSMPPLKDVLTQPAKVDPDDYRMACWELVHMGFYGMKNKYGKSLADFLDLQRKNPSENPEVQFEKAFNRKINSLDIVLSNYWENSTSKGTSVDVKAAAPNAIIVDANPGQIGRIKGDAFVLAAYPDKAKTEYSNAYRREKQEGISHDDALTASMGLLQMNEGEIAAAVPLLEMAVQKSTPNAGVYLALAKMRIAEGGEKALTLHQTMKALEPLIQARELCLPNAEIYRAIGDVCEKSSAKPGKDVVDLISEGTHFFPADMDLLYREAEARQRLGDLASAKLLAERGAHLAPSNADRSRFAALIHQ